MNAPAKFLFGCVIPAFLLLFFTHSSFSQEPEEVDPHQFTGIYEAHPDDVVFLDVRTPEEAANGRLRGSLHIPLAELRKRHTEIPRDVEILIYSSDGTDAERAYYTLKDLGYTALQFVRAEPVFAPDGTFSLTRLRKGEISTASFTKTAESKPDNVVLLDVRTQEEASHGMLENAILIPVADLQARCSELPRNKEIIIYCSTGARSPRAYTILKGLGFENVRYLREGVKINPDGTYTIKK